MISGEPFLLNESWNGDIDNAKIFYNWKLYTIKEIQELPESERIWIAEWFEKNGLW